MALKKKSTRNTSMLILPFTKKMTIKSGFLVGHVNTINYFGAQGTEL